MYNNLSKIISLHNNNVKHFQQANQTTHQIDLNERVKNLVCIAILIPYNSFQVRFAHYIFDNFNQKKITGNYARYQSYRLNLFSIFP